MMLGKLKIENIDVEQNKEFLEMIYEHNDDLELEFSLSLCEIAEMFKYYVNRKIELIGDMDQYDCIYPEFKNIDNDLYFTLNASDDDEDNSDINHIDRELKKHFGVSALHCKAEHILKILLMNCNDYYIDDNVIHLTIYYENYKETWIGPYLSSIE